MDNDGTFREYNQRNDNVIHCDSEEYKELLMKKLESGDDAKDTNVPGKWIFKKFIKKEGQTYEKTNNINQ